MMESVIRLENFYLLIINRSWCRGYRPGDQKGSFTVVAGPSGAGKTTLCKAMTGIVPFYMGGRYSGDVQVLGESTAGCRISRCAWADAGGLRKPVSGFDRGRGSGFQFAESRFCAGGGGGSAPKALEDVGLPKRVISWTSCRAAAPPAFLAASVYFGSIQRSLCWMSWYRRWPGRKSIRCMSCYMRSISVTARSS